MKVLFHGTGHYPPGAQIGPSIWPHYDLFVVTRGIVRLTIQRKSFELAEGDSVIIPPHHQFQGEGLREDTAIWVMHYQGPKTPLRPRAHLRALSSAFSRELLLEFSRIHRGLSRTSRYQSSLADVLLERLEAFPRLPRLSDIQQSHLLPHNSEPRRVHEMASNVGLSDSHYRSKFRQVAGVSPRQYLKDRKAEKARSLLRETRLPIKEIATLVGYSDVASFHRAFTALSGTTPARFRRSAIQPA